ncbi:hypothetical protein AN7787.2 [Aspergillus nidulans FGSC A4]|uniref:Phytanoyl-CoA dioxygenase n=1 Tax=Emericella nidulans (strain FGSC A4 / ATCC 38163 / CBS 112.46 / NRRL 194 / M139) TaxID=227321 RepID=Q5AV93_EMENI|nr:hypothetical protein [Aspergillus nidulans FGSC A4]EAA61575.1 hypothetical protein AN7787.2 [Aspergillus nidulans FGSC A4]CBF80106.1 TPA: conserved hypothetical protein [Aspergillus nidulans FGSC A4]|eukprot:XP_681056.1 hypothetical protein AN7787.2 [Aspergillus nidulans FGSC A4]
MSTTTMTTALPGRIFSHGTDVHYGDFRDDLLRNGFAVVKGAVPRDRALKYADEIYDWLEEFGLGFNRHDPSTIHKDHLPDINEKGMCLGYAISHESFTWAVRQEPGVIAAFEKVYDTPDLIVSFDSVNIGFPNRTDIKPNKPWPHQDQDPEKPGFRCLQGLVNLLPNGPDDGGLIVCKGAHLLSEEFHEAFKDEERIWSWYERSVYSSTKEWYGFTDAGLQWLRDKGCEWIKLTAEPGDLLLWDSRTPHYNLSSKTSQPRFAVYTCYMPVEDATTKQLQTKKMAFEETKMTTHWPNAMHVVDLPVHRNGELDPYDRKKPRKPVQLTDRGFKLTGIPYLEARA